MKKTKMQDGKFVSKEYVKVKIRETETSLSDLSEEDEDLTIIENPTTDDTKPTDDTSHLY